MSKEQIELVDCDCANNSEPAYFSNHPKHKFEKCKLCGAIFIEKNGDMTELTEEEVKELKIDPSKFKFT